MRCYKYLRKKKPSTVFCRILDALFCPEMKSQIGGSVQYMGSQNFESLEWRNRRVQGLGSHPQAVKQQMLLYKAWNLCFWQIY